MGTNLATSLATDLATNLSADMGGAIVSPFAAYGATHHWDAQYNVSTATGVSSWVDLIAGLDVTQGTGSKQPTYSTADSAFGDGYSIAFDSASSQELQAAAGTIGTLMDGSKPFSLAWVALATDDANSKAMWSVGDTGTATEYWYAGYSPSEAARIAVNNGGSFDNRDEGSGLTTAHYCVVHFDGDTTIELRVNGSAGTSDSGFGENPSGLDTVAFGSRVRSSGSDVFFAGKIRDFAIFNVELSGANLTAVEAELASRAGI